MIIDTNIPLGRPKVTILIILVSTCLVLVCPHFFQLALIIGKQNYFFLCMLMNFLNWFVNIRIFKDSLTNSKILRIPAGVLNTIVFILKPQQVKPQQLQQPMFPEDLVDVCILKRNQKKTFKFISYYLFQ